MIKKILQKIPFRKIIKVLGMVFIVGLATLTVILVYINSKAEIPKNPEKGVWYRVHPENAVNGDGSAWHGLIRKGRENKVVVYFFGGGVSTDEYTAAHPEIFYHENILSDGREYIGIGSEAASNPFRDWTFLVLPYTTGDFHIGDGEFCYKDEKGEEAILYHHGYRNYRVFMDRVVSYAGTPDEVLVAGYSAGGFAAALLADDVMTNYFPKTENTTVLIDSSVLLSDRWKEIIGENWNAPECFTEMVKTDNLICDAVSSLKEKRPDAKVLFDCSVRDGTLSAYQNYMDSGAFEATDAAGDVFTENLKATCRDLIELPEAGIFIWDSLPYIDGQLSSLTQHSIIVTPAFDAIRFNGKRICDWAMDAVNGKTQSYGMELLE